ncbi:MAG: phenylphosphate carboxylase subunit delta [Longimicrobiales bacterium]|nr:phenylphosphate carboxylase subunit delta [Longimicrobiales bacterium]
MAEGIPGAVAEAIRVVVLDVDGVLTDNGIYLGAGDERIELKRFHIMDGLGIKMLQWAGLRVVLVSGRESPATTLRADELGVESRQVAGGYKIPLVEEILAEEGAGWDSLAVVADDLADLPAMMRAGLPVAVANAAPEILAQGSWVTHRPGGGGAVREFAEALLGARGQWRPLVEAYRRSREEGGDVRDYLEMDA